MLTIKNLGQYLSFEVVILDDKGFKRRFRASNFQVFHPISLFFLLETGISRYFTLKMTTRVKEYILTMPLRLEEGWNQVQLNLADINRRAYGTNYVETLSIQLHANCRIRRVYFADRLVPEESLPQEFKLFLPVKKAQ